MNKNKKNKHETDKNFFKYRNKKTKKVKKRKNFYMDFYETCKGIKNEFSLFNYKISFFDFKEIIKPLKL